MDLTFSGAGFMGCYYFGVVDCWQKYIPRQRVNRVAGASAGSLIAASYVLDLPLKGSLREIVGMTEEIRQRPLGVFDRNHQMVDMLPKLLDRLFPDDAHKQVSGRLFVGMTRLKDMKNVVVNEFESKKDLIDALNCSCFIPVWSGNHVSTFRGEKYIDGGFSDNLPVFDEHTIRVCCFAGQTDISPTDSHQRELLSGQVLNTPLYFTMTNLRRFARALWPPTASQILDLLELGFHNTKQFILDNDLIQCESCYRKFNRAPQGDDPEGPAAARKLPSLAPKSTLITPCISPALSRANSLRRQAPGAHLLTSSIRNDTSDSNNNNYLGAPNNNNTTDCMLVTQQLQANNCDQFERLLNDKLKRSRSPDSLESQDDDLNSVSVPCIVITEDANQQQKQQLDKENAPKPIKAPNGPSKKKSRASSENSTLSARRKSLAQQVIGSSNQLTVDGPPTVQQANQGKFTGAPDLLPSCPPSPNLNRHCKECFRLRQAARNDHVEDNVRQVAESFCAAAAAAQGLNKARIKTKLVNPLRWIRQLKKRHSYKFNQEVLAELH